MKILNFLGNNFGSALKLVPYSSVLDIVLMIEYVNW